LIEKNLLQHSCVRYY